MLTTRVATVALVFVGATALALAALVYTTRASTPSAIELRLPDAATSVPRDGQMKVYITGAVRGPGVYTVRPGDRVGDLLEVAGGPTDEADTLIVNFARRLRDEDHILIPRRGEPPIPGAGGTDTGGRIDLNTATAQALEALPGIGPSRAQKIVESRGKDGPFADPAELVKRKLLPQSVFDAIRNQVDIRP